MPSATSTQSTPDPIFSFSIVQFQVEGVLFSLPNYVCEQSEVLQGKVTSQQPCILEDVTAAEFRDFLRCLIEPLPRSLAPPPEVGVSEASEVEDGIRYMKRWVNTLKLATLWDFQDVRSKAISKIEGMDDPPLKLAVACQYNLPDFLPLAEALRDLADPKVMTPLNKEDYEILGLDLAIKVVQYREQWNRNAPKDLKDEENYRSKLVEEIFGSEVAKAVDLATTPMCLPPPPPPPGRCRARRDSKRQ